MLLQSLRTGAVRPPFFRGSARHRWVITVRHGTTCSTNYRNRVVDSPDSGDVKRLSLQSRVMNAFLGLGDALRHGVNLASLRWFGSAFPYGTLTVNVADSLAMGLIVGWFASRRPVE